MPETWEEYNELSIDGNNAYFDSKVQCTNVMHMYINTSHNTIRFTILLPIVDIIIKELFYYNNNQILIGIMRSTRRMRRTNT
jgi:hypothetical protein